MLTLPNSCKCSDLTVTPDTWAKQSEFDKNVDWIISYRFYDSSGVNKRVRIKRMNRLSTWKDRKEATDLLIDNEKKLLMAGQNPVTLATAIFKEDAYEIHPTTAFPNALFRTLDKLKLEAKTRQDIKNVLKHIEKAAISLSINNLAISEVRRKHIKAVLERVGTSKPLWSANSFNHYRKYLSVLFKELVELEACEYNPVQAISKQKVIRRIRETATKEQQKVIDHHLRTHYRRFWLFMQIFYHSGARTTELLKVQAKDVDLQNQTVKITIIKGKARREVKKVIKDVALPYWREALQWVVRDVIYDAQPDDYIFSTDLLPGKSPIRAEQISRRWRMHVKAPKIDKEDIPKNHKTKGGLGINVDFYSLKHLHSDQVAAELGLAAAGHHNSHTNTTTTRIYAIGEAKREEERIKSLQNKFAE